MLCYSNSCLLAHLAFVASPPFLLFHTTCLFGSSPRSIRANGVCGSLPFAECGSVLTGNSLTTRYLPKKPKSGPNFNSLQILHLLHYMHQQENAHAPLVYITQLGRYKLIQSDLQVFVRTIRLSHRNAAGSLVSGRTNQLCWIGEPRVSVICYCPRVGLRYIRETAVCFSTIPGWPEFNIMTSVLSPRQRFLSLKSSQLTSHLPRSLQCFYLISCSAVIDLLQLPHERAKISDLGPHSKLFKHLVRYPIANRRAALNRCHTSKLPYRALQARSQVPSLPFVLIRRSSSIGGNVAWELLCYADAPIASLAANCCDHAIGALLMLPKNKI